MSDTTDPAVDRPVARVPMVPVVPHPPLSQYYSKSDGRQAFIDDLFSRTAHQYRNIERAIGFGSGVWYRRKALQEAGLTQDMHLLDVACGPGLVSECARDIVGPSGSVIGLDPSSGMLREAQKGPCQSLVLGIGEQLPFLDESFDFLSMGYALRHVSDIQKAFSEYWRVLKPGGTVLILEISRPHSTWMMTLLRFYLETVLGNLFSCAMGTRDMRTLMGYYSSTIEQCVPPDAILMALENAGFKSASQKQWFNGLLRDYRAVKLCSESEIGRMRPSVSSPIERDLAALIVQTLKLKVDPATIQPEAALFGDGLGLDSIDALELSLAISQTYGYQLKSSDPEIKAIFSSLRALSKAIEKNRTK